MARIKHGTLVPNEVTTVNDLDGDAARIELLNRNGLAEVFYNIDSDADPEIDGDNCEILVGAINADTRRSRASGSTTVKMISSDAVTYTIRVADDD